MVAIVVLTITAATGASPVPEPRVKSAYIYNFTKFIEWKDSQGEPENAPITICVFGTDPVGAALEELSGRQIKGRPLKIVRVKDPNQLSQCQIAFVGRAEEPRLPLILQKLQGSGTLTVSDIPRFAHRGGMIGFQTEQGKVKIEINARAAREAGLKMSAKLLEVARVIP